MSENNTSDADHVALADLKGKSMTYGELKASCDAFGSLLLQHKIGGGCRVAILLEKSFASAIAVYTSLNISAAYIPIDVSLPKSRIDLILADCNPHVILHQQPELFPGHTSLPCSIRGMESCYITVLLKPNYEDKSAATDCFTTGIAYILYTSGSTGIPKGVCVSIEAANSFIKWARETFKIERGENIASIAPFHFDLSVLDLFVGSHRGATLHLFSTNEVQNPRLMCEELSRRKINFIYATPTFYTALLEFGKIEKQSWSSLHNVLFAGEVFPVKQLHQVMDIWKNATFCNLYGPTETNVCAFAQIVRDNNRTIPYPIGKPCSSHEMQISVEGELLVGGPHVANEYLNRPELSKEKFFIKNNMRWFRTGDRVEVDEEGMLVYKGRLDRMVKRRGYRIEPGEIESALHQIKGITGAAIIAQSGNDIVILTAVVTMDGSRALDIVQVKSELMRILPDYMLPDSLITVKEFPKTSSGKIDYQKLQQEVVSSLQQ